MNVKTEPLLTAVTVGIILQLTYYLTYLLTLYSVLVGSASVDALAPRFSNILTLMGCLIIVASGIGCGFLYVILHARQEPVAQVAARGGGHSGGDYFCYWYYYCRDFNGRRHPPPHWQPGGHHRHLQ